MCGRFTLIQRPPELEDDGPADQWSPRYNIAPTQNAYVVRQLPPGGERRASLLRWGLIPGWFKPQQTPAPIINARCETAADKPSFRTAYQRRRCLVPADGFYEWKKQRQRNQPFYFQLRHPSVFYMAGLWESWSSESGGCIETFAILTTRPNELIARFHDRMPAILHGEKAQQWLDGDPSIHDPEERLGFFAPIEASLMACRPVSPYVNNNRHEGPKCLEEPAAENVTQLDLGLG